MSVLFERSPRLFGYFIVFEFVKGSSCLVFALRVEVVIGVDYYILMFAPEHVVHSFFAYNLNFALETL